MTHSLTIITMIRLNTLLHRRKRFINQGIWMKQKNYIAISSIQNLIMPKPLMAKVPYSKRYNALITLWQAMKTPLRLSLIILKLFIIGV